MSFIPLINSPHFINNTQGHEVKLSVATNVISMFEFLQVLAFFLFVLIFQVTSLSTLIH